MLLEEKVEMKFLPGNNAENERIQTGRTFFASVTLNQNFGMYHSMQYFLFVLFTLTTSSSSLVESFVVPPCIPFLSSLPTFDNYNNRCHQNIKLLPSPSRLYSSGNEIGDTNDFSDDYDYEVCDEEGEEREECFYIPFDRMIIEDNPKRNILELSWELQQQQEQIEEKEKSNVDDGSCDVTSYYLNIHNARSELSGSRRSAVNKDCEPNGTVECYECSGSGTSTCRFCSGTGVFHLPPDPDNQNHINESFNMPSDGISW